MLVPLLALSLLHPAPLQEPPAPAPTSALSPAEPEDVAVVHYFDRTGAVVPLEMHRAQYLSRARLFRGAQGMLVLPGTTSPVRFVEGEIPTFVVNVLLPMQLPTTFELFPLVVRQKEQERALILSDDGVWNERGSRGFHIRTRRHGKNSFLLISTNPLPPGEYAFKYGLYASQSKDMYCFTVVPKPAR